MKQRNHGRGAPSRRRALVAGLLAVNAVAVLLAACGVERQPSVEAVALSDIPGHEALAQDNTPKERPRLMTAENYIRSLIALFGGLSAMDTQEALRGKDGSQLFDVWVDYLASIGLPDYKLDTPRGSQGNAMMVATFERMGAALCERAAEQDLASDTPKAVATRTLYRFDIHGEPLDLAAFRSRFDELHRSILGYPVDLAPADRVVRFFALYTDTVSRHSAKDAPRTRLKPEPTGWAVVCEGLIRHPEFHAY